MTQESSGRVQRSVYFDADGLEWLRERGKRLDRSVDWQLREMIRAAMAAEAAAQAATGGERAS